MRETGSKITANNDKITIAFDRKIRLGPLHTLVEGYLQLTRDQQKQIDYLLESLLAENEVYEEYSTTHIDNLAVLSLADLKTKKERILNIVKNRANPNYLTAREIQELYQHYMKEEVGISTIQTNLNRLVDAGLVERQEGINPIEYRINPKKAHEIPKVLM
ncbi:MAG: transcriptional repressor [Promethearchaeota archaeon]